MVETGARHIMASDAAVPNVGRAMLLESDVATAPAGLLLLRPGKGQGGRQVTDRVFDRDAPMRSRSMRLTTRCMMTAILRATATAAFFMPLRLAIRRPQALSADHFSTRVSKVVAASNR